MTALKAKIAAATAGDEPRVLVVGNYAPDQQHSMRLYARTLVDALRAIGIPADAIEPAPIMARLARGAVFAKLAGYIDKYLLFPPRLRWRARGYDIVHITDHSNAPYLGAAGHRPAMVTCHDMFAVQIMLGEIAGQRFGFSGRLLQRWVLRNLKRVQHFASVSDLSASELRRITGTRAPITVIPNALLPFFHTVPPSESARAIATLGLDPEMPYLLHVGGNQYYKNRPGIVRLFAQLATEPAFVHHRLVLAGKPPDTPLADALAASPVRDRIDVVIGASDEAVRSLYNRASALLFLSLQEGFGWPILEAQACGCPVVTTDAEPMRTVAGGAALLVDPADPQAARTIAAAADRLAELTAAGIANAGRYRSDAIAGCYAELYRSMAQVRQ